jgi:diacylglycerol kinase
MAPSEPDPTSAPPARHPSDVAFSPSRFWRSFLFAWEGVLYTSRSQPNWRIHLTAAAVVVIAGAALRLPLVELALLALTIGLVLTAEAVNTAVESTVDALGGGYSLPAKHAKDAAAAAVLIAAATSLVVGALLFIPRLVAFL